MTLTHRELAARIAEGLKGVPYIWGGALPAHGFDCSGFVIWILQTLAVLTPGDWTAQGLFRSFSMNTIMHTDEPRPGDLAFYGDDLKTITHVMMHADKFTVIGATGGNKHTLTRDHARQIGAQVKAAPTHYRGDYLCSVIIEYLDTH